MVSTFASTYIRHFVEPNVGGHLNRLFNIVESVKNVENLLKAC